MKRYSIGLFLAGIGLIAGSCIPLSQALWFDGEQPVLIVSTPSRGGTAPLEIPDALTVLPVAVIEMSATATDRGVPYEFSIAGASGKALVRERGTAAPAGDPASSSGTRTVRLPRTTLPSGRWTMGWHTGPGADGVRSAEIRLLPAVPGPVSLLLTALVLGILGWLSASLGAFHWIRTEAAQPGAQGAATRLEGRERVWVVGCHLSALAGYLLPFGHLAGPLAVWLSQRRTFAGVERAGRDVLNFQLSMTLYVLVGLMLSFFLIGLVVLFLVVAFHFSMVLYASLRAQRGLDVVYPLSMRFI